jgi:uncharacterized membrane protein YbhN (UPF0104 family)
MKKKLKIALGFLILLVTFAAFTHYISTHPQLIDKLEDTSPGLMVVLIGIYIIWFLAQVVMLRVSLKLFDKSMPKQENLLLNAYSSLVNFFGPGQSGPVFRAAYLKKRYDMRIKDYMFATLLYYGFYAIISAFFLFVGSRPWWQTLALVVVAGLGSVIVIRWYAKRSKIREGINIINLSWLFGATAVQLLAQLLIFYLELRSIHPQTSLSQALTYTGAANFALFVSLTPGAIGIREAFLVFSQNLHHLSNSIIVGANLIDRAVYLIFLGLLFLMTLALHAKDKLRIKQVNTEQ